MKRNFVNESRLTRRGFLATGALAGSVLGIGSDAMEAKPVNPSAGKFGERTHGSKILAPKIPLKKIGLIFEDLKRNATKEELYHFLYALPKGGDIHHHFGGGMLPEMWFDVATDKSRNGDQEFYTRHRVSGYFKTDVNKHRDSRNRMFWTTISESSFKSLPAPARTDFKAMTSLNQEEREEWLGSVVLDKDYEGRDEFFEYIWPRLNELLSSIDVMSELLVENMKRFAAEGVRYLEIQTGPWGWKDGRGNDLSAEEANAAIKRRLNQPDAVATGVTVRFQGIVVRFEDDAEEKVERFYEFIDQHRDFWVGLNMAGREDDNRGYAARFTDVYDRMLRKYPGIGISIHAGEAEKRDTQIFDTLRLGATRIGHGINLFQDEKTMQVMRGEKFLVEINLISNELLGYVPDLDNHPFPIYLRQGIPVCLNTDDRGMWHSNMTDEYYVAVSRYNLSWKELISLGENSLVHSFLDEEDKMQLVSEYNEDLSVFADRCLEKGWREMAASTDAVTYDYGRDKLGLTI